jgi:hypothetical protein
VWLLNRNQTPYLAFVPNLSQICTRFESTLLAKHDQSYFGLSVCSAPPLVLRALADRHWNNGPMYGCQIGTKCHILHAKQDQSHPTGCVMDVRAALQGGGRWVWVASRCRLWHLQCIRQLGPSCAACPSPLCGTRVPVCAASWTCYHVRLLWHVAQVDESEVRLLVAVTSACCSELVSSPG